MPVGMTLNAIVMSKGDVTLVESGGVIYIFGILSGWVLRLMIFINYYVEIHVRVGLTLIATSNTGD